MAIPTGTGAAVVQRPSWVILVGWIAFTLASVLLVVGLMDAYLASLPDYAFSGDNSVFPLAIFFCGLIFVVPPLVGVVQGVLIRVLMGYTHWMLWAAATTAGIVVALIPALAQRWSAASLLFAVPGILLGSVAQGRTLARYTRKSREWVIASIIGCVAGLLTIQAVDGIFAGATSGSLDRSLHVAL
ncbi:MAG: hypothetical protein ABI670_01025 [Chloroflexota bacterium]